MKKLASIFIAILIIGCSESNNCENFIRRQSTDENFSGIIKKCYFKIGEHGTPTVELENGSWFYLSTKSLICYAQPGDSIFKNKGSLKYEIKRKDSVAVFYPECGKTLIMDSGKTQFNPNYMDQIRCDKYE